MSKEYCWTINDNLGAMEIINCSEKNLDNIEINTGSLELNGQQVTLIQLVDEKKILIVG